MNKHIHNHPNSRQLNSTKTPMLTFSRHKSLFILFALFALLLTSASLVPSACAAEKKLMAIIVPSPENPFFKALADAAEEKAKSLGYETLILVHNDDPVKQAQLFETAIARKAAAIIVDNAGADATVAAVKKAKAAGIPSFLADREINSTGDAVAQIVSNNFQGAVLGAEEFVRLDGRRGRLRRTARQGDRYERAYSFQGIQRHYQPVSQAKEGRGSRARTGVRPKPFKRCRRSFNSSRILRALSPVMIPMALGAYSALKAAGKGKVIVVGFDGSPDVAESIKAGEIRATVLQPVVQLAQMAAEQANQYIASGKTGADEKQSVDCILITPDNVKNYTSFGLKE